MADTEICAIRPVDQDIDRCTHDCVQEHLTSSKEVNLDHVEELYNIFNEW